jgi:SAM-dependent methyltransferase
LGAEISRNHLLTLFAEELSDINFREYGMLNFKTTIKNRMEVIEPLIKDKKVLDLGVVDSRRDRHQTKERLEKLPNLLFRRICDINPETMGVDIDKQGIALLRKQGFNVEVADVMKMDLGKKFDVIIAGEIIEHLENPGIFLRNMAKHLEPDGVLLVTTPNPFYFKQVWQIFRRNRPQVHEEHTCWFDPMTMSRLAKICGLKLDAGYWIQPSPELAKTWPRLLRNYFSHSFVVLLKPAMKKSGC